MTFDPSVRTKGARMRARQYSSQFSGFHTGFLLGGGGDFF